MKDLLKKILIFTFLLILARVITPLVLGPTLMVKGTMTTTTIQIGNNNAFTDKGAQKGLTDEILVPVLLREVSIFIVYLIGLAIIIFMELLKVAKYITYIDNGLDNLENMETALYFPNHIKSMEYKLLEIRQSFDDKEKLLQVEKDKKHNMIIYLAHDLKTPLTSIIGYLTLLEETPDLPIEQRAKYTKITLDKAYRLEQLINEFFEITSYYDETIMLEYSKIDLNIMLEQMADEFYPILLEKGLLCEFSFSEDIKIEADPNKLARVFDNLMKNAVNYCHPNSTIYINTELKDGQAFITFENTGDEISQHNLQNIFEKFYRMDSSRKSKSGGSGLGLAIAKNIIQLHKGELTVESVGKNIVFTVNIPVNRYHQISAN